MALAKTPFNTQPVPLDLILDADETAPVSPPASPRIALIGLIFPFPSIATLLINLTENVDILSSLRFWTGVISEIDFQGLFKLKS